VVLPVTCITHRVHNRIIGITIPLELPTRVLPGTIAILVPGFTIDQDCELSEFPKILLYSTGFTLTLCVIHCGVITIRLLVDMRLDWQLVIIVIDIVEFSCHKRLKADLGKCYVSSCNGV